jgi:hypothetical protein
MILSNVVADKVCQIPNRVARWFVFKPKIQIWVNFGGSWNGKSWYILEPFGLFYGNWKYFMVVWYILWSLGIFFPVLVFCTKKNLATLIPNTYALAEDAVCIHEGALINIKVSFFCFCYEVKASSYMYVPTHVRAYFTQGWLHTCEPLGSYICGSTLFVPKYETVVIQRETQTMQRLNK